VAAVTNQAADRDEEVLVAVGLRKSYDVDAAPVRALRGADLAVRAGELVAVTGPSGSGKSTLLNIVAGLERPDEGSVRILGRDLVDASETELARIRRRHVGIVFQFFNLLDGMTAVENVALAALAGGAGRREATDRAHELLDLLGLLGRSSVLPPALSGGERQRLAIARALANEPDLLLADEPTGALDSESGAEVIEVLARLHAAGRTLVVVTHSPDVAAAATRVVAMRDGEVVR
jgi:putative ABC transport system ATP-binding protein